ncbi:MAG: HK97 gp10 family phage protein [Clostridium lundense]|nr:HK97 gp10 family phage protein [Clostridium lundense]
MARWGRCHYRQLQELQRKMQQLEQIDIDKLCIDLSNELAQKLLRKVKKRTPVGVYPANTGLTGGTLRRNWDVTRVQRQGYSYSIEVFNDTEYAIYVEFGHRTRNHNGWVPGKFMLTISEKEIDGIAPKLAQRRLEEKLREVFDT